MIEEVEDRTGEKCRIDEKDFKLGTEREG